MKVAVIGATGQLGGDAVRAFTDNGDDVLPLSHDDVEVSNIDSAARTLRDLDPELIINTAAMHNVERCEQEPENAFAVNALGARNLARVAQDLGAIIIQISTDYVFDGDKTQPYEETDAPRPLNAYGSTKLAGEHFIRFSCDRHFVLRTSGLYGRHPCRGKGGLNFVDLMLKLGKERGSVRVVNSETVSPTSTYELAQQMVVLSRSDRFGLYHATAEGSCSWYDFAREIFSITRIAVEVQIADPKEFPTKVRRPQYSVLENTGLKSVGMNSFRPWQKGLSLYLTDGRMSRTETNRSTVDREVTV